MDEQKVFLKRLAILVAIIVLALLIVNSDFLFECSERVFELAEVAILKYPVAGIFIFVLLTIASAMLAFFSSAILVPVGIQVWGTGGCFLLLLLGWLLGGALSFAIGFHLGRPITSKLVGQERYEHYKRQLNERLAFTHILLFQAAVPSEIPGYMLGTLRFSFAKYFAALSITEVPYALGTVYLGSSFLSRDSQLFMLLGGCALLLSACAYYFFRAHLSNPDTLASKHH